MAPQLSWVNVEAVASPPGPADSDLPLASTDPVLALADVADQLQWVADALIPAAPELDMPSAVEAGVIDRLLPRALQARPDLAGPLVAALADLPVLVPEDPLGAVRALEGAQFELVSHVIAGAYFLDDEINRRLKYPGQESLGYDPDFEEIEEVINRVIARGPVFIDV
ncbi:MAG: hypothetical protein JWN68_1476 [Nocardioides sp.]|nr:hypothetical protein [Nocardioides sp.]